MLLQAILNIFVFFLKCAMWVFASLVAIPLGILLSLEKLFPIFSNDAGFWFYSVWGILTIIAYIILWKPILWIVGTIKILGEEF